MNRGPDATAGPGSRLKLEGLPGCRQEHRPPARCDDHLVLDHNIAEFGDTASYRYLDYEHDAAGRPVELTWHQLGIKLRAVGARLQQVTEPGDRVAILAPQGVDYVVGFFAAIQAGNIAVPCSRRTARPRRAARRRAVGCAPDGRADHHLGRRGRAGLPAKAPAKPAARVLAIDAVPDAVGATFVPAGAQERRHRLPAVHVGLHPVPAGVEITHRAVCTNVVQMVISVGLDFDIASVSWLPLFHDMGLLMIMFPAIFGAYLTLMSPTAFVRRPHRWIKELSVEAKRGRTFAAAPNFAFELAAQRGLPPTGEDVDLSNVAGLINGSEPVNIKSIEKFNEAFAPYGLPRTAIKPSYGMAEATLFVSTIGPQAEARAVYLDLDELAPGRAVTVSPDARTPSRMCRAAASRAASGP